MVVPSAPAWAQRTDVVTLANGDRITGEIVELDRGRLEFKTDDAGTISFEWDKIARVEAARQFEVSTADGRRFLGSLAAGNPRSIVVVELAGMVSLPTTDVTTIVPIGSSFWKKLDGSVDVGFSYTRSSHIGQLNINTNTMFRRPAFEARLTRVFEKLGERYDLDDARFLIEEYRVAVFAQRLRTKGKVSAKRIDSVLVPLEEEAGAR